MTTKLVSANMGIILVVEQDGEEKTVQWSAIAPKHNESDELYFTLGEMLEFINSTFDNIKFGIDHMGNKEIDLAKSKRLKPSRPVSQNEFNKRIKELGYKP